MTRLALSVLAVALTFSACAQPDAEASPQEAPAVVSGEAADPDPASGEGATEAPEAAADAPAETIAPAEDADASTDEEEIVNAVSLYLRESVDDGPQPPSLDLWETVVNVEGFAGFFLGAPTLDPDAEQFAGFCGGIANALAPEDGAGEVRAYLRRGTAGGWTVIDATVCVPTDDWELWEEQYGMPSGLAVRSLPY